MSDRGAKRQYIKYVKLLSCGGVLSLLLLLLVVAIRTFTLEVNSGLQLAKWKKPNISTEISQQEKSELITNFKAAIQIPTVSVSKTEQNTSALEEFNQLLKKVFPTVFASSLVKHEVVNEYSHLFTVQGTDPTLLPYMLLAHIDVVPADEKDGWEAPPFSAQELNGFIYGRGTIDDKQAVMGIMQALEFLLVRGYVPRRGFYIGLGHDEEVNGLAGAVNIVKLLKSRGVKLEFVLDEGLAIMDGVIEGLNGPAALIGVTEKGQANVKLSVNMKPGHSSMPPKQTSIGILAAAVASLESNPMPRLFGKGPEKDTFEQLAYKFDMPLKFIMSNLWLFAPLLGRVLESKPESNTLVRTTTAVTMFNSGVKLNVLPAHAESFVNLRIHSAQTLQEVMDLIESTISDDRVRVELMYGFDPLPVSPYDDQSFGFQLIKRTVLDLFPEVAVAPGVCVGNTDSRHYTELTKSIYRFAPVWFKPGDSQRFHGINERISAQNYEQIVLFFFRLIQNCDISKLPLPHSTQHEL